MNKDLFNSLVYSLGKINIDDTKDLYLTEIDNRAEAQLRQLEDKLRQRREECEQAFDAEINEIIELKKIWDGRCEKAIQSVFDKFASVGKSVVPKKTLISMSVNSMLNNDTIRPDEFKLAEMMLEKFVYDNIEAFVITTGRDGGYSLR